MYDFSEIDEIAANYDAPEMTDAEAVALARSIMPDEGFQVIQNLAYALRCAAEG